MATRLDHCQATRTLAACLDHCVDGDGRVRTNSQATKTLWQHALSIVWVEMEGYLPTARQPQHCGSTPCLLCGWRWKGIYTYQLPGNQNTVAARLGNYVGGGVPTRQPRLGHNQATRTLVSRLDHCVGGGIPANSQATKTLAARIDHCVDGDGGVLTNSQATKTLWQHALATVWVEGYLPTVSQPQHCGSTP